MLVNLDLVISSRGRCGRRSDENSGGRFGRHGEARIMKKPTWAKKKELPRGFLPEVTLFLGGSFFSVTFSGVKSDDSGLF